MTSGANQTISFTYDSNNYLTKITDNAGRETNYTYILGSPYDTVSYSYTDNNWKNGVTQFGNDTISYDVNGNPTTYRGYTMTWDKGCQLASANKSGITTSYKYDFNGIRTEKTVDGVKTEYFYAGSTLMSQKSGNNVMNFYYNADGSPYGFTLNGTPYYYILNLQGDVIGIYNGNGTVIVSYVYNSWGKLLSITGTGYYIGLNNPLRYRGYVYDTETELYYLQSRYYDPETGRFISADSLLVAGDSINGTNMFAYCCNNPVNFVDPSGRDANPVLVDLMAIFLTAGILVGTLSLDFAIEIASQLTDSNLYGEDLVIASSNIVQRTQKGSDGWINRKDKRKGSDNRQKTGARERNVAHPEGEEHSRRPKGTSGVRKIVQIGASVGIAFIVADDLLGIGIFDDVALPVLAALVSS